MSNPRILSFLSQYELLERTAQYLSTLDLFHLALTSLELYAIVRESEPVFERLKRVALCDGHGLKARQEFKGRYAPYWDFTHKWTGHSAQYDEEIEVRVWNLVCDATNALPCLRCGVNVCEECRYVPRVRDDPYWYSRRRPYRDASFTTHALICYCSACDEGIEEELPLRLSEYCDCDQYTRWICLPCKIKEDQAERQYYATRTKEDCDLGPAVLGVGMLLMDHQFDRAFYCPCGRRAPKDGNVRCAWCRRRHNMINLRETPRTGGEDPADIPYFDNDPCFPKLQWDHSKPVGTPIMYPPLGYTGPIAP